MLVIDSEANEELVSAAAYWNRQTPGLGRKLLNWWKAGLDSILAHPQMYPLSEDAPDGVEVRDFYLRRMEYRIIYLVEPEGIKVLAFAHIKRRPGYWLDRLT